MIATADKVELRAMVFRIIDVFQEADEWPPYWKPRQFLCGRTPHPIDPDLPPYWTTTEVHQGREQDNAFKRNGIPAEAFLSFITSPPDLDSRPLVYITYYDDDEPEILMVDVMKWMDDPWVWEEGE